MEASDGTYIDCHDDFSDVLGLHACSETETPISIEPQPVGQYEIPAHIPLALAESYADVQAEMTEHEYQAFLQYMYDLCLGDTYHTAVDLHLQRALSEMVYNRAKGLPHPAATYDDRSRILVASWFKDPDLPVAFDPDPTGLKVIYWRAKYIILLCS